MINKQKIVALIPARKNSKRLPKKNLMEFHGKPLIQWTIESALKTKFIDKIIVSSDDVQILSLSKELGVNILEREKKLAKDSTPTFDVIEDTLKKIKEKFDILILLQPTSPLRNKNHIEDAFSLYINLEADSIVSVTETEHPQQWINTLPKNGSMKNFLDSNNEKRSQQLKKFYRINGAIYIANIKKLMNAKTFF